MSISKVLLYVYSARMKYLQKKFQLKSIYYNCERRSLIDIVGGMQFISNMVNRIQYLIVELKFHNFSVNSDN